ncbi:hypothetical protein MJO28_007918 [Puccinia striiformis f. sp. tritici]|uniref:Uncharacterized protein n=1 Tax=Puccinia striiformis f. sp. tritici TaxID=168172 RepID=A0ACC0E918_9BASI|nr:hypothetical protein MJO28_007918 [Puccinia striiformis f. sp. tritici]
MVSTSTMTRLQLNPTAKNSTEPFDVTDLDDIVNFLSSNAGLELGRAKQTRFWIISALMFLMAVLYFITIIKNITIRNYWLVERNKNGYLNPNIEVLIPLFSVIHSSLVFCSIVLMHQDNGRYLSQPTMVTQLVSYNFLFYSAATRVWRTLSVIPLVPVQLTAHGTSLLSNGFPPFLFNTLVVLLYMSFPVATLPVGLTMARGAGKIGREVYNLIPNLKLLIAQQDALPDRVLPPFLVNQIDITLESLHGTVYQVNRRWRITCAIYLFYCSSLFALFIYASVRLYSTLTVQLKILTQARLRFARMTSVGVRSFEDDVTSVGASESTVSSSMYRSCVKSFKKLKSSLWAQSQDQSQLLEFWDCPDSCVENAELVRKTRTSVRYRTALLWQSFCSGIIFASFVVLTACLAFDVFGVPNRRSATQVGIITFEWSGWAWSVPGSVLAFVTCCVALVPHSASEVTTKATPTRNSVRKSGAKDNRYPPELSRTSTESDAVNLRPFGVNVAQTPQLSIRRTTITGGIKSAGSKIWRKLRIFRGTPSTALPSPRERKFSCFSFSEDEKIGDHVVHPISPGHGIDIPNDTIVGQPPMSHTSPSSPRKDLLPLRQMGSDINIIKSLRQQHP